MKEIMTPHEAPKYLNLNVRTSHRLGKNGKLQGIRLGEVGDSKKMFWINGFQ
jgi:hypothetical protein